MRVAGGCWLLVFLVRLLRGTGHVSIDRADYGFQLGGGDQAGTQKARLAVCQAYDRGFDTACCWATVQYHVDTAVQALKDMLRRCG